LPEEVEEIEVLEIPLHEAWTMVRRDDIDAAVLFRCSVAGAASAGRRVAFIRGLGSSRGIATCCP
jgi:hypothetical protein